MFDHVLKASLEKQCLITIIYQKGIEITERNIKVFEISKDKVKAFCYLRGEMRVFKKENILSAAFCSRNRINIIHTKFTASL